jgi:hypothetical protein
MKNYFENMAEVEIHLVLSATTKEKDLFEIVSKLRDIPVHRVLFTKVDESNTFGNILNVLIRTKIPLSYLTRGRKVPDDIEPGSLAKLLDLIFQAPNILDSPTVPCANLNEGNPDAEQMEKTPQQPFIANKNSDVYHYLDCNWAKKIKPDHIVKFASARDAEFQNFLPCRSCNPNRIERIDTIESRREKMNITSNR